MRIKVTETRTIEFDVEPEFYDAGATPAEMIAIEKENAENYPGYFDYVDGAVTTSVISAEMVDDVKVI